MTEPCPKCGSTDDLNVGDCGYSSFNVAWVRCLACKLEVTVMGDSAVSTWNKWVQDPVGELVHEIRDKAKIRRKMKQSDFTTMQEFVADIIDVS